MELKIFGKTILSYNAESAPAEAKFIHQDESTIQNEDAPDAPVRVAYVETFSNVHTYVLPYNGEKNLGELGPVRKYLLDHEALRTRSWQLFLDSEICQIVFSRFDTWVIGQGLKLQADPQVNVLQSEGIDLDIRNFDQAVEDRFKVYANSKMADYSGLQSLHSLASTVHINSIVGGDALVVLRYIDGLVKVQIVDGSHVSTPYNMSYTGTEFRTGDGNIVRHGIELDKRGMPIAYYVRNSSGYSLSDYERIPAVGKKSGLLSAFMVYGLKYRLDNVRGIPLITAIMETAKKMDRYKEATLGSAEERAKIAYAVEHELGSTGENPLASRLQFARGSSVTDDLPKNAEGEALASRIAASTGKQAFNLPQGSKLASLDSKNDLYFKDFYGVNIDLVCATVGIPSTVAMSKYDTSYSSSRAANKDWEHSLIVRRKKFADQFYQNVYNFWLETQILSDKVQAPGYFIARGQKNQMALESFRFARWVGANVPHIDPVKEVKAEREKLGSAAAHVPLTTAEAATEVLNGGDFYGNVKWFAKELEETEKNKIPAVANAAGQPEIVSEEET